ncbi:MAG: peptidase S53, partial [Mycobacteriaceae bacterium]|nr:peptidase S53 [Mycobacteriaceae bacterium]
MSVHQLITALRRLKLCGFRLAAVGAAAIVVVSCDHAPRSLAPGSLGKTPHSDANVIAGPYARLLAGSTDLGPDKTGQVQLTAALKESTAPQPLMDWAHSRGLTVRWQPGWTWAYIDGAPSDMASAFAVAIHTYQSPHGQLFYASPQQPVVPPLLAGPVTSLGHIINYQFAHPLHRPPTIPLDVPKGGLAPDQLKMAYNAGPLGTTGKGVTVVLFEGFKQDGYKQSTLDAYVKKFPQVGRIKMLPPVNGQPGQPVGETEMDIELVHAIAPDAQLVTLDIDHTPGGSQAEVLANAFTTADQKFPGAVWSISMGFGCDHAWSPADSLPIQAAVAAAETHGTSVFESSGDNAGYECKWFNAESDPAAYYSPPTEADKGVDPIASLPAITDVGGTTLSTDQSGAWAAEEGWIDVPSQQGTGGGPASLYPRPSFQSDVSSPADT